MIQLSWLRKVISLSLLSVLGLAITLSMTNYVQKARAQNVRQSQPPSELSRLEYFEGTWRCQQPAAPISPSSIFTWTVKRDLNNFWYIGNAEEIKSPDGGTPINSQEFLGYDTASQKLRRYVVVGNGNSYNLTASNWQDGKLVWLGTIVRQGSFLPLREEIIQNSPHKFTATYFIPDGVIDRWKSVVSETCNRVLVLE